MTSSCIADNRVPFSLQGSEVTTINLKAPLGLEQMQWNHPPRQKKREGKSEIEQISELSRTFAHWETLVDVQHTIIDIVPCLSLKQAVSSQSDIGMLDIKRHLFAILFRSCHTLQLLLEVWPDQIIVQPVIAISSSPDPVRCISVIPSMSILHLKPQNFFGIRVFHG